MIGGRKAVLVVDDSEIDREILKSILSDDFEILEADNGKAALHMILEKTSCLDVILLDVSMPFMDGFSVLQFMKNNKIGNIPVFLVTAGATRDNVEKAARYNVSEFIGKPFKREEILKRIKAKLGVVDSQKLTEKELEETDRYISTLRAVYDKYLVNFGKDKRHYERIADLMKILLSRHAADSGEKGLDADRIGVISRAAYFCDIGNMLIPPELHHQNEDEDEDELAESERTEDEKTAKERELYQKHTILGAELVNLNSFGHCQYFVQVCTDICSHHHERYDGKGFPHRIIGEHNTLYAQLCGLLDRFDRHFYKYHKHNELQLDFCIRTLAQDVHAVSEEAIALLKVEKSNIIAYYTEE